MGWGSEHGVFGTRDPGPGTRKSIGHVAPAFAPASPESRVPSPGA
ncbi:hypothetical protein [Xanthomonas translucens]|nr:hypothetical protein [Xanthomonas translucens]